MPKIRMSGCGARLFGLGLARSYAALPAVILCVVELSTLKVPRNVTLQLRIGTQVSVRFNARSLLAPT